MAKTDIMLDYVIEQMEVGVSSEDIPSGNPPSPEGSRHSDIVEGECLPALLADTQSLHHCRQDRLTQCVLVRIHSLQMSFTH